MTIREIQTLQIDNSKLREENEALRQQVKALEGECDRQCQTYLIEQVRQRYDVPTYLLETSYAYGLMMKMNLTQLERFMSGRAMIFYGREPKLVREVNNIE